ncbi:MAG: hypothetical protein ABFD96_06055 [Armatimonadia bacterium]
MRSPRHTATAERLIEGGMPEFTVVNEAGALVVSPSATVVNVTPVLDTAIYAADDLLFNATEIPLAVLTPGGHARLESIVLLDEDDQGVAMDLLLLDASASLGTLNGAFAASDTLARAIVGRFGIVTGDYADCGGFRVAQLNRLDTIMRAATGQTSLWVAGITRGGTPTHTAAGLRFKFGFTRL